MPASAEEAPVRAAEAPVRPRRGRVVMPAERAEAVSKTRPVRRKRVMRQREMQVIGFLSKENEGRPNSCKLQKY